MFSGSLLIKLRGVLKLAGKMCESSSETLKTVEKYRMINPNHLDSNLIKPVKLSPVTFRHSPAHQKLALTLTRPSSNLNPQASQSSARPCSLINHSSLSNQHRLVFKSNLVRNEPQKTLSFFFFSFCLIFCLSN